MEQSVIDEERTVPKMVTIRQLAEQTGISEYAIRRMCKNNEITFIKTGTKYLVNFNLFIDFLNSGHHE